MVIAWRLTFLTETNLIFYLAFSVTCQSLIAAPLGFIVQLEQACLQAETRPSHSTTVLLTLSFLHGSQVLCWGPRLGSNQQRCQLPRKLVGSILWSPSALPCLTISPNAGVWIPQQRVLAVSSFQPGFWKWQRGARHSADTSYRWRNGR